MLLQSVLDGLLNGGIYALIALGLTLIFGVMKIINMAHGEFLMIGMYASYFLYRYTGVDPFLSIPLSAAVAFLFGVALYRLGVGKASQSSVENTLLFTAGAGLFVANLAQYLWSPNYVRLDLWYGNDVFRLGGLTFGVSKVIAFVVTAALICVVWHFLHRTETGSAIRAASQDPVAAQIVGVNVARVSMLTFGIGAAFSAIAGTMLATGIAFYPTIGTIFVIKAFIVVVLGGMGNIFGAALGGLLLGVTESLGAVYLSSGFTDAYGLVLFILILLFRPQGILAKKQA